MTEAAGPRPHNGDSPRGDHTGPATDRGVDRAAFLAPPAVIPPLDPSFRPLSAARRRLESRARAGAGVPVTLAVEQPGGAVLVRDTWTLPDDHPDAPAGHWFAERLLKSMLWSRGGARVWIDGPAGLERSIRRHYQEDPTGIFDARLMGDEVYLRPFEVVRAPRAGFPVSHESNADVGRHLEGCRIGFDLGASDRKAAAVVEGQVVFSEEVAWDPRPHEDPQWHVDEIMASLRSAAAHMDRVDAIGGSAAGVYVDSLVRVASLFRGVPRDLFEQRMRGIFRELGEAWGVPLVVANDGDVTALAGAMQFGVGELLGIAMGSSEAAGYVTSEGRLTSWLNELAFVPIDAAPTAPEDEWSGDRGCGVQYLSQQAVGRLLPVAGIAVDPGMPLPERLIGLQALMADGDERALRVYETIGVYLGYALLEYRELYDYRHVLLLGRVMTGTGGDVIRDRARGVLLAVDPESAGSIAFHEVSERDKRHGQAVAAASLPALRGEDSAGSASRR